VDTSEDGGDEVRDNTSAVRHPALDLPKSRLTHIFSGSPGVGKTLTVEGLSEYLERPLYAVRHTLRRQSSYSDFSDICWGARLGRKNA